MHLTVAVSHRRAGMGSHPAGAHLMGSEHHYPVRAEARPLDLSVEGAQLLARRGLARRAMPSARSTTLKTSEGRW